MGLDIERVLREPLTLPPCPYSSVDQEVLGEEEGEVIRMAMLSVPTKDLVVASGRRVADDQVEINIKCPRCDFDQTNTIKVS